MTGVRARALYEAGISRVESLAAADEEDVAKALAARAVGPRAGMRGAAAAAAVTKAPAVAR